MKSILFTLAMLLVIGSLADAPPKKPKSIFDTAPREEFAGLD